MGDLNYRINLPRATIDQLISNQQWDELMEADQLQIEMKAKRVFEGFKEKSIHFPPTYKFDPGTQNYDTSEKRRSPAWCDRILYRGKGISCLSFSSHPEYIISDHKPVSALFQSIVKNSAFNSAINSLVFYSQIYFTKRNY